MTTWPSSVLERFLRYVRFDTRSDPKSERYPSTEGQLVLLRALADELRALGLDDVAMDDHGYVVGNLPASSPALADVPAIAFFAHVDTSPEASGRDVKPIVHARWDGSDIVLPDDETIVLRADDDAHLAAQVGNDIVTASGTTLLGADNKAGVAEIVAAVQLLLERDDLEHGPVKVVFTPDEEIGRGTLHFDVDALGAAYAYTVDSESLGQLDTQTFSADGATVTFRGYLTHPGYAKGAMVNALKVACDFVSRLPRDRLSPETTDGLDGFVHPMGMDAAVAETSVHFILRDFTTAGLEAQAKLLGKLAEETVAAWPGSTFELATTVQYRNMKEVLDANPGGVDLARRAIRDAGLELVEQAIRGGTDGSWLSARGLPTPNIFAGEHNYHSVREWVSVQDMEKAVEVICRIAGLWARSGSSA